MKLLTKEIIERLKKAPLYSTEKDNIVPIIVKFFCPWSNWTWYAVEGSQNEDGDWEFFGLVEGFETELGNFCLSELQSVTGPGGLQIERDMHFDGMVLNKAGSPPSVGHATIHYAGE
jgi:hypothetical protein